MLTTTLSSSSVLWNAAAVSGSLHSPSLVRTKPILSSVRNGGFATSLSPSNVRGSINIDAFPPSMANTVLNVCPQGQVVVVERFGKMSRVQDPGLFFSIPLIDRLAYVVDLRELCLQIPPQSAITRDNVSVDIGGALYVQITDPVKACYNVRRVLVAVRTNGISAMRTAIGTVELDELLHNRDMLNKRLKEALKSASGHWGIEVMRYELTEIHPDREVSRAMDAQATAERRKREAILNAEAVRESHIRQSEGVRQESINHAEGKKREVVLAAEARKEQQELEAAGQAAALERIASVLNTEEGKMAMNFYMANQYVKGITSGLHESSNVFLNEDVSDVSKMVAKGMGIVKSMNGSPLDNQTK